MIFLGYAFTSGNYTLDSTPSDSTGFDEMSISSAVWDELYLSNDTTIAPTDAVPTEWDFNTCLHALFNENLQAGNVSFYASEVSAVLVKRRKAGEINWITLATIDVTSPESLTFEYLDNTPQSRATYEYMVVPVVGGVEGYSNSSQITTDFCGLFILSADGRSATTQLDVSIVEQRNGQQTVVQTLNRKYPFVVSSSQNDFDSGTVSAVWIPYHPETDEWDIPGAVEYRNAVKDILNSRNPILIRYEDGRMWLVHISNLAITDTQEGFSEKVTTAFSWTEIGDGDSGADLKSYGFTT